LNSTRIGKAFTLASAVLVSISISQTRTPPVSASPSETAAKPLLLEKNEGEARLWRDPPPGGFMLKVSPQNNGSQHLVFGTEDMHPGDEIPLHKHLGQDEIVTIQAGTVHVSMAFVFSAPGFENLMRCASVPPNEKPTPTTLEERRKCDHQGHVIYKEDEESPKP
jgi:hypothetical protein